MELSSAVDNNRFVFVDTSAIEVMDPGHVFQTIKSPRKVTSGPLERSIDKYGHYIETFSKPNVIFIQAIREEIEEYRNVLAPIFDTYAEVLVNSINGNTSSLIDEYHDISTSFYACIEQHSIEVDRQDILRLAELLKYVNIHYRITKTDSRRSKKRVDERVLASAYMLAAEEKEPVAIITHDSDFQEILSAHYRVQGAKDFLPFNEAFTDVHKYISIYKVRNLYCQKIDIPPHEPRLLDTSMHSPKGAIKLAKNISHRWKEISDLMR